MSGPLCHLAHDIGKSMGGKFHVAHGNACASTLPQVLQVVAPAVPDRVRYIAETFGAEIPADATPEQIGDAACVTMQAVLKKVKLPSLKELGFTKEELLKELPDMVAAAQVGLKMLFGQGTSPVPCTPELISTIISRAYDEN